MLIKSMFVILISDFNLFVSLVIRKLREAALDQQRNLSCARKKHKTFEIYQILSDRRCGIKVTSNKSRRGRHKFTALQLDIWSLRSPRRQSGIQSKRKLREANMVFTSLSLFWSLYMFMKDYMFSVESNFPSAAKHRKRKRIGESRRNKEAQSQPRAADCQTQKEPFIHFRARIQCATRKISILVISSRLWLASCARLSPWAPISLYNKIIIKHYFSFLWWCNCARQPTAAGMEGETCVKNFMTQKSLFSPSFLRFG